MGGPGNDVLDGGNAPDDLEGEDDEDVCVGGRAPDRIVNCEVLDAMGTVTASLARAAEAQELTAEGGSRASEPAEGDPGGGPATPGDDKDSVEVDQRNEGELFGTKSTSTLQSSQDPQADDRSEPSTVEQSQTSNASTEEAQQPAPEPQTCGESPEDVVSSEMASYSENHGCETTP